MAHTTNRGAGARVPGLRCDWLKELDKKVRVLPAGSNWVEDSDLLFQRCRRFIMARFPKLPRPLSNGVLSRELSEGEKKLTDSDNGDRIMRGLDAGQRSQLAGLLQDVIEASEWHARDMPSSKKLRDLASAAKPQMRKLSRKLVKIRGVMEDLRDYAKRLHDLSGSDYVREAVHCLKTLETLETLAKLEDAKFYSSLKSEYPALEDPKRLGMVELYWFFHDECRCSGKESEVRVAMIANAFFACKLKYKPRYIDAESQGCSAVRMAVSRYRPRTTD